MPFSLGATPRYFLAGLIVVIGFGSLFVSPVPVRLGVAWLVIGGVAGALLASDSRPLEFVATVLLLVGIPFISDSAGWIAADVQVPWWQAILVASASAVSVNLIVRRFKPLAESTNS